MVGTEDTLHARVLLALWVARSAGGLRQAIVLVVAWLHGCMGLHFWLRLRPWYPRVRAGDLQRVPAPAGAGAAGLRGGGPRDARRLAQDPAFVPRVIAAAGLPKPEQRVVLGRVSRSIFWGHLGLVALILVTRGTREHIRRRQGVRITYPGGREVLVPAGFTILEASRFARDPARLGVRRPRALLDVPRARDPRRRGPARRDRRRAARARASGRAGPRAPGLPGAAPARPRGGAARARGRWAPAPRSATARATIATGASATIAVLFADLRGFTRLAERKLPYDVVFFLNRYFEAVGGAITDVGGIVNQFTGDGVMALFGVDTGPEEGCRQAVRAAAAMVARVHELSRTLADDLATPLRLGIGIHAGPTVVGQMGYATTTYLTAVGDTVHVAARLEALTKEYGVRAGALRGGRGAAPASTCPTTRAHELTRAQPRGAAGRLRGAERGTPRRAARRAVISAHEPARPRRDGPRGRARPSPRSREQARTLVHLGAHRHARHALAPPPGPPVRLGHAVRAGRARPAARAHQRARDAHPEPRRPIRARACSWPSPATRIRSRSPASRSWATARRVEPGERPAARERLPRAPSERGALGRLRRLRVLAARRRRRLLRRRLRRDGLAHGAAATRRPAPIRSPTRRPASSST